MWHKVSCYSLGQSEMPPEPTEGFEATNVGGIARRDGEIGVDYLQTNMSSAAACQLPSPCPSVTTPDSSNDKELGAWIYKNWCRFQEGTRCLDLQELALHKET